MAPDGTLVACKLQYPDMKSAVEADLGQLGILLGLQKRVAPAIDTTEIAKELGERLREELDYAREAKHAALFRLMLKGEESVCVPEIYPDLSTDRLLTMRWLDGKKLLAYRRPRSCRPQRHRQGAVHRLVEAVRHLWRHPRRPASRQLHGVREAGPRGGNQSSRFRLRAHLPAGLRRAASSTSTMRSSETTARASPPPIATGASATLDEETVDTLTLWARFIYGPLMDDRVRTIAGDVAPQRLRPASEAWEVKQRLKNKPAITVPREFVFLERAAIGLGAVMLHLKAEINFHQPLRGGHRRLRRRCSGQAPGQGAEAGGAVGGDTCPPSEHLFALRTYSDAAVAPASHMRFLEDVRRFDWPFSAPDHHR